MRYYSLAALVTALALNGQAAAQGFVLECDPLTLTGTFSDLRGNLEQTPTYLGTEVRIVRTEQAFDASIQFGGSRLFLADVAFEFQGWPLHVPLPRREPDTECLTLTIREGLYAGVFVGTLTRYTLAGEFVFNSGERLEVNLPRVPEVPW